MLFRSACLVLAFALLHCSGNATTAASSGVGGGAAPGAGGATTSSSSGPGSASGGAGGTINPTGGAGGSSSSVLPDASADGPAPGAPPACGTRTGMRGMTMRSLTVAGLMRTYIIYLPAGADPATPLPFVFVFHGYTMSGQEMYDMTQYTALADSEGIGLAFPDGEGGPDSLDFPWNVEDAGQTVCGAGQYASATCDDFAFMDAMKADVSQDQCLDTAHVFATGFSMGGYFTEHVGCYRSDIRAVAPHSGGTLANLSVCTTGHVPVILFHGTGDSVIDDACDDPTVTADPGFPPSATLWAAKNGCQNTYSTVPTLGSGGGLGQCYVYDGCPADGQVELCTFTGMNHCWAGGTAAGSGGNACPTYAGATQLEWTFFKTYAW
jgi:polyhydroxybutyrate depolymerase